LSSPGDLSIFSFINTRKEYGFIFGQSTALQLLEVIDKWTEALDLGYSIDCVYMDYQKAFDALPHTRLHNKLTSYGIHILFSCEEVISFHKFYNVLPY
jgi:hypothetical protein